MGETPKNTGKMPVLLPGKNIAKTFAIMFRKGLKLQTRGQSSQSSDGTGPTGQMKLVPRGKKAEAFIGRYLITPQPSSHPAIQSSILYNWEDILPAWKSDFLHVY
jgi:hypothetical protein